MRQTFRLGIDLDGVLYPFAHEFTANAETMLGRSPGSLPLPVSWRFYEDWGLDESGFHSLYRAAVHDGTLFAAGDADPDLLLALDQLSREGVELHVLTARHLPGVDRDLVDARTHAWLDSLGLRFATVEILSGSKNGAAARLGLHAHLDDAPEHLASLAAVCTPIAWHQPWNDAVSVSHRAGSGSELHQVISLLRPH